jgi:hypothetical protein
MRGLSPYYQVNANRAVDTESGVTREKERLLRKEDFDA